MKKIFFSALFLIISIQVFPCDACGCSATGGYIGILPQFNRHFIGVRYQFRYFSATSSTHSNVITNEEYYHTWNIWGRISPHKRVQILINAPVHYFLQHHDQVNRELAGPGDIWALAQYQVLRTPDSSTKKIRQSLFVGGGIKLPTGRYNMYDVNGMYERNMQPGTGSWDFLVSSQYTVRWKGWGINAEVNGRFSTLNPDNYLYGHKMNAAVKGFYWGKGKKVSILTSAGLLYDFATKDIYMNLKQSSSGGQMISGAISGDLYLKRWVVGLEFRMPIYARMSNGLLNPGPQLMSQIMYTF